MKVLLHGYFDRNFGDDMMMRLVAEQLPNYTFMAHASKRELLIPFEKTENIVPYTEGEKFDFELWVTGSGFTINSKMALISAVMENFRDKKICSRAVIGCNIGPFLNSMAERVILKRLRMFDYISVRERWSYEYVRNKLPSSKLFLAPDILFGMPSDMIPAGTSENALGMVVYRRIYGNNIKYYRTMAEAADRYIDKTGKRVILFAFDAESENDICAAYTIRDLCRNKDMIEIIVHSGNGDNILEGFARCGKIAATRFHGTVLALRMGIPVVPVIYSDKTRHMLEDIEFKGNILDIDSMDTEMLYDALKSVEKSFDIKAEMLDNARKHINYLKEVMQ